MCDLLPAQKEKAHFCWLAMDVWIHLVANNEVILPKFILVFKIINTQLYHNFIAIKVKIIAFIFSSSCSRSKVVMKQKIAGVIC